MHYNESSLLCFCSVLHLRVSMAEVKQPSSLFHPLISHSALGSTINAPRKNSHSTRKYTMPSSSPLLPHMFLLSLISFFTVMSIFFLIVTVSLPSKNREPSLLASLFGAESSYATTTLPSHPFVVLKKMSKEEAEFWKQEGGGQAGGGYSNRHPCLGLDFSFRYRKSSVRVSREKRRFLVVLVSGDLFQLRNQIIDAVLFSRILEAALVVPVFEKESGLPVESEFADIFDLEHFIRTLRSDVRVVASHPYPHLTSNQVNGFELPRHVTPQWLRTKFSKKLNDDGVLVLNGIESKLTGKLPPDLLKLRCKVAFHALRFSNPIREIGYRLGKRLWIEGPYAAFDLGLNSLSHNLQSNAKHQHEHLTKGLVVGDIEQQIVEVTKCLKGLGVPRNATLYATIAWAKSFGTAEPETPEPLLAEFPNLVSMQTVARAGELLPFVNSLYAMAAIDYIVSLSSDVFLVSEETHLGLALQEHWAYTGKKKVINLRQPELRTSTMHSRDATGAYSDHPWVLRV